jgi:hypothetical protein
MKELMKSADKISGVCKKYRGVFYYIITKKYILNQLKQKNHTGFFASIGLLFSVSTSLVSW